jgi:hypothetical protein
MSPRFGFTVIDATREIHDQQTEVRSIIQRHIRIKEFKR